MADSSTQQKIGEWVRDNWLRDKFGQLFQKRKYKLTSGGVYQFSAVSQDGNIVGIISTSGSSTASGNIGVGKLNSIRADMYFLILAEAEQRIVVLTEKDMYEQFQQERNKGRVPVNIEFLHAELPDDLRAKLEAATDVASREVSPRRLAQDEDI